MGFSFSILEIHCFLRGRISLSGVFWPIRRTDVRFRLGFVCIVLYFVPSFMIFNCNDKRFQFYFCFGLCGSSPHGYYNIGVII